MADARKRVLQYPEKTTVDNTDYMLIDSATNGTNKYQVTRILTEAEAAAQTKVDAEEAAREAADNALKNDLKHVLSSMLVYEQTDTAEIASFTDGADDFPIKSLILNIEPHQAGNGDPSPTNVRAISGYTSVNVTRAGKNVMRVSSESVTESGVTFTVNPDGTVTVNGTNTGTGTVSFIMAPEQIKLPRGNYILTGAPEGGGSTSSFQWFMSLYWGYSPGNNWGKFDFGGGQTYQLTDQTNRGIGWRIGIARGATINNLVFKPMLRLATDLDGTFEPNRRVLANISLPSSAGAVYCGELDVMRGVLKITHNRINLGSLSWAEWPNLPNIFRLNLPNDIKRVDNSVVPDWLCSTYMVREGTAISSTDFTVGQIHQEYLLCHDSRYTTASDLKTALDGQLLVYELATVTEYTLTQPEINTLLGANNIWMDADGTVEVDYPADTKLYIDSKLT